MSIPVGESHLDWAIRLKDAGAEELLEIPKIYLYGRWKEMLCFIDGVTRLELGDSGILDLCPLEFRVISDGSDKVWSCSISLVSCYDAEGNARKEPIVKPFSNETTDIQIASYALFRAQHTILNPIRSKTNLDGFGRIKRRNELGYSFDSVCVTIVGASSAIHFTALPVTSKKLNPGGSSKVNQSLCFAARK
ncbi:hypothetical protein DSO57_1037097 [Entomophthora muscae]|uniref:Uncharacterized protein n=1 Tax=Entomophthora muscae TaxID=34485 RepID=A0ACC2TLI1_9FUNG|nr:hypothetical protein DSO57_1037097 [Entomophthora muscae]